MVLFSVIKDIEECKRLWEEFSPKETLFEFWEYRSCLYDSNFYEPYFIVGREGNKDIGLLPLWKVTREDWYEFFGGYFTERNRFFVGNKELIPLFLTQIPHRTCLSYIESSEAQFAEISEADNRYFIDLERCGYSLEGYLKSFSSKHRKNLKRDLEQLEKIGYKVYHNRICDYERMAELNCSRFGHESFFADKLFTEGFRRLICTASSRRELQMISIEINGIVEAVEIGVLYRGNYNVLMGGNNLTASNVGKLMTIEHIKNACTQGARQIDFLSTDTGWKKLWKMNEDKVYEYTNMTQSEITHLMNISEESVSSAE